MSKKDIVCKFNEITRELLQDVSDIVGYSYLIKFNLIIKFNCSLPIQKFQLNVLKFKKIILNKNSEYFENDKIIMNELTNSNIEDIEYFYVKNIIIILIIILIILKN